MGLAGGQLEHSAVTHFFRCPLGSSSGLYLSLPVTELTLPGLVTIPIAGPAAGASASPPTASQNFCVALLFLDPGSTTRQPPRAEATGFSPVWLTMQAVYKNLRTPCEDSSEWGLCRTSSWVLEKGTQREQSEAAGRAQSRERRLNMDSRLDLDLGRVISERGETNGHQIEMV